MPGFQQVKVRSGVYKFHPSIREAVDCLHVSIGDLQLDLHAQSDDRERTAHYFPRINFKKEGRSSHCWPSVKGIEVRCCSRAGSIERSMRERNKNWKIFEV